MAKIIHAAFKATEPEVPKEALEYLKNFPGKHLFAAISQIGIVSHYHGDNGTLPMLFDINKKGHNAFFTVNEMTQARRRKADIKSIRSLFIDIDTVQSHPRTSWPVPPSIVVESSKGKYHYYWLTQTEDKEMWDRVQDNIINTYDGDPNSKDLARILRIPGSINHKTGDKCKLIDNNGTIYKWEELIKKENFPPNVVRPVDPITGHRNSRLNEVTAIQSFLTGEPSCITGNMNSLILSWSYHYGVTAITRKMNDLFDSIPNEVYQREAQRYEAARAQVDKFVKTAKNKTKDITIVPESVWEEMTPQAMSKVVDYSTEAVFPEAWMPDYLKRWGANVYKSQKIDPGITYLTFLTTISACLSKAVVLHEKEDFEAPVNTWLMEVSKSGSRKGSKKVIYLWMKEVNKLLEDEAFNAKSVIEYDLGTLKDEYEDITTYWKNKKKVKKKLKKGTKDYDRAIQVSSDIKRAEEELAKFKHLPDCFFGNGTVEGMLDQAMASQGRTFNMNLEAGDQLKRIIGVTSNGVSTEEIHNKGFSNEDATQLRAGGTRNVPEFNLSKHYALQPIKYAMMSSAEMDSSGFTARFNVYFTPFEYGHYEEHASDYKIDAGLHDEYIQFMIKLYMYTHQLLAGDNRLHVHLTDKAAEMRRKYNNEIQIRLRDDLQGDLVGFGELVNKLVTQCTVLGLCASVFRHPSSYLEGWKSPCMRDIQDIPLKTEFRGGNISSEKHVWIDEKSFIIGKKIMEDVFIPNIKYIHENKEADHLIGLAHEYLRIVERGLEKSQIYRDFVDKPNGVTFSMLNKNVKASLRDDQKRGDSTLSDVMDILIESGWVRVIDFGSRRLRMHPEIRSYSTKYVG